MTLTSKLLATAAMALASTTAMAHTGHSHEGFTSGLLHPMLGLDHLLAMAAIGFWSVRQNATMKRGTPLFVIGGMLLGATIAWGGVVMPGVETGIVFSVLLAGILIATLAKLPTMLAGSLVAAFMVFHGFAHGAEMPEAASLVAYMAGLSIATLLITFVGCGLGALMLKADNRLTRTLGAAVVATGSVLAAA